MRGFRFGLPLLILVLGPFASWSQQRVVFVTVEGQGALAIVRAGSSEMISLGGRPWR